MSMSEGSLWWLNLISCKLDQVMLEAKDNFMRDEVQPTGNWIEHQKLRKLRKEILPMQDEFT